MGALPPDWREQALAHGVVGNADAGFTDSTFLMRGLCVHVGCDVPLRQTVALLAESGFPEVSHVCLHRRMRKAAPFIQELVSQLGVEREESNAEHWGGYQPVMLDGSVVVTPGVTAVDGRLHVALRLADLSVVQAFVSTIEQGESLKRFSFEPGQLAVGDRGFANPVGLQSVVAQGADVLVRVNRGSLPLYGEGEDGERIDVHAWVSSLAAGRVHGRRARVESDAARVDGRLIAKRIPLEKRAAARERARREFGNDPVALAMAEWLVLFTTASRVRLSDAQAVRLYRLRWQIELLFKRWKSLCNLDKLPNYRPDTVESWLAIKLLLFMCAEKLAQPANRGLSPPNRPERLCSPHACPPTLEAHEHHMAVDRRGDLADAAA